MENDYIAEIRDQFLMLGCLVAAAAHSETPEDQVEIARDFFTVVKGGDIKFVPDEGCRATLARCLKQNPDKLKDAP